MISGEFTSYFDLTQVILYAFWIFFFGLIIYLHREGKREGYPLQTDREDGRTMEGFPKVPEAKEYRLPHDQGSRLAPRPQAEPYPTEAEPVGRFPGAPLHPTGNPLTSGVGPGAWAVRPDVPDLTNEGTPRIVPLRVATDHSLHKNDPDPRGKPAISRDGKAVGNVTDAWVDQSEPYIRYLEIDLGERSALVPITFVSRIDRDGRITILSLNADQFAGIPGLSNPDQITLHEEDRISAYYGGGEFYNREAQTAQTS